MIADTLDAALTRAGKSHRFVVVPNADHSFNDVKDRAVLLREVESFLSEHLPVAQPAAP
jgi:dipeptidyl aminopeptidase/acylaminoacyl peptidase